MDVSVSYGFIPSATDEPRRARSDAGITPEWSTFVERELETRDLELRSGAREVEPRPAAALRAQTS